MIETPSALHFPADRYPFVDSVLAQRIFPLFLGFVLVLMSILPLAAQTITTGDLTGTITDQTGAVVPGSTVTLKSIDTGESRTQTVNESGAYRFTFVKPGKYEVSASSAGLKSDLGSIVISIGQVANVGLVLKPQSSTQVVVVTDAVPLLQTDNANQSTTLTASQIQTLPTPGGDTTTVAFTAPGVVVSTGAGYGNFSSHGLPGTSNLFTTNGNDNMDPYLNLNNSGASNLSLGANEIAEAAVVQNAYTASYGRQAGANVNIVTKSGTNEFHGNLGWYWNGAILNANDFFANQSGTPKGRANSNQYAASIGGPIVKNKTFFFVDMEGLRYVLPNVIFASIPSPQFQSYVLSTAPASALPLYQKAFDLYRNAPGVNRARPVTTGSNSLQDSSGSLGCGSFTAPYAGGGTFGQDVPCAYAFASNANTFNPEWLFTARVDHQITNNQRIFFRYKMDRGVQATYTDPINPAFNAVSVQPSYEGQVDHTWTISSTIVNHAIASASYYTAIFSPANLQQSLSVFPTYFQFAEGGANGTGAMSTLGVHTTSFPQGRRVGQGQLIDDLSWTKGSHTLKFGVNFRKNQISDTGPTTLTQGGTYYFGSLDSFASGQITSQDYYQQRFSSFNTAHLNLYNVGFYVQDEWAVSSNFKLTLGIRFDRTGNIQCADNCFARLNAPFTNLPHGASIPYNQSITPGLREAFPSIEPLVYQPRIGFVYNPGTSKTVIRGGIGLFSDQPAGTLASSIFNNSPNVYTPQLRVGTVGSLGTAGTAPTIASQANSAFRQGFGAGYTLAQINAALPAGVTFTPPAYFSLSNQVLSPKYAEWSFELQQGLGSKNVINLSYTGNHGYNLFLRNAFLNSYNANGRASYGFLPNTAPDSRFRVITNLANDAVSNYNGFTAQFRRSFSYGFQGQVSYTWSHAQDDISNGGLGEFFSAADSLNFQLFPYNKSLNYSNADYDIRHNVTGDFTWDLPFKTSDHLFNAFVGGWNVGSKIYARTGTPFSVYVVNQSSRISASTGGTVLAAVTDPSITNSCGRSAVDVPCFTASQFTASGFGNYPRNTFRGPGYFDIDFSASKNFALTERFRLAVGASFYNLLNHPNFANPGGTSNVSGLGTISSTVTAPTSAYGSFQGSAVSGRVIVTTARLTF